MGHYDDAYAAHQSLQNVKEWIKAFYGGHVSSYALDRLARAMYELEDYDADPVKLGQLRNRLLKSRPELFDGLEYRSSAE